MTFGGSHGAGSPTTAATAINTAWTTHIRALLNSGCTFLGTRVKFGPMDDGPFAYVAANLAGTRAGSAAPPNTAALIRKSSSIGGRQGTGRMYQPGLLENEVSDIGDLTSTPFNEYKTAYTAFLGALNSVSLPMYLLHSWGTYTKLSGNDPVFVTVDIRAPTEVLALTVDSKVATQRRRLR